MHRKFFIPFAFDTFGGLCAEAVLLLDRLQRAFRSSLMSRDSIVVNYVFRRVGFAIQRGVAAQIVSPKC